MTSRVLTAIVAFALMAPTASRAGAIDFERDVAPILETHCIACHGPRRQAAGLRLDAHAYASLGGISGLRILGGGERENELYRRVRSNDAEYRMPRFADPLPPADVETIRAWVEAGTPWPSSPGPAKEAGSARLGPHWGWTYQYLVEPILPSILVVVVAALMIERIRRRPRRPWIARVITRVRFSHALLVVATLIVVHQFRRTGELHADILGAERDNTDLASHAGAPPVLTRPDQPRAVARTYYRGNCERDERLFNGGNYRTCTFHLDLCDMHGRRLSVGDELPRDGVFVRLDVERAPLTTEQLFTPRIIDAMFLSPLVFDDTTPQRCSPADQTVFTPVTTDWRWRAMHPIATDDDVVSGLVYFYRRTHRPEATAGEMVAVPHYGIHYRLRIDGDRLADDSDLWMNALFVTSVVAPPPPPGLVPFQHWFDHRPLPVITEANPEDPALLGVTDDDG